MERNYYYKKLEINQTYEEYLNTFIFSHDDEESIKNDVKEYYRKRYPKEHFEKYHKNDNYGVFAGEDLEPGDLIDTCMYVGTDRSIAESRFGDIYTYTMTDHPYYDYAVVGGVGMFFNNAIKPDLPNVGYRTINEIRSFEYYAIRHVKKDEQLFTDYGHGRNNAVRAEYTHPKIIQTPSRI